MFTRSQKGKVKDAEFQELGIKDTKEVGEVISLKTRRKSTRPHLENTPYRGKKFSEESNTSDRSRPCSPDFTSPIGSDSEIVDKTPVKEELRKLEFADFVFHTPNLPLSPIDGADKTFSETEISPLVFQISPPQLTDTKPDTINLSSDLNTTVIMNQQQQQQQSTSGQAAINQQNLQQGTSAPVALVPQAPLVASDPQVAMFNMMMEMMKQQETIRREESERVERIRKEELDARREEQHNLQKQREAELELREKELELRRNELELNEKLRKEEIEATEKLRKEELEIQRRMLKSNRMAQIPAMRDGDCIETYLSTYELTARSLGWDDSLWVPRLLPLLTPRAQEATHVLSDEDRKDYEKVKKTVLEKFQVNEEFYRQKFRSYRKKYEDSYRELASSLSKFRNKWLRIPNDYLTATDLATTKALLSSTLETIALEQFYSSITNDYLKMHVVQQKPTTVEEAAKAADEYLLTRKTLGKDEVSKKQRHSRPTSPTSGKHAADATPFSSSGTSPNRSRRELSAVECNYCHKKGHMVRNCPNKSGVKRDAPDPHRSAQYNKDGRPKGPASSSTTSFSGLARSPDKNSSSLKKNREILGRMNGKPVKMILDSGSDVSLVRADLVDPKNVNPEGRCMIDCVFGDTHHTPTTVVKLEFIRPDSSIVARNLEVGVVKNLPVDVLLGYDFPDFANLVSFDTSKASQPTSLVVTRSASAKRTTSLSDTSDDFGSTETSEPDFLNFDDSIFSIPSCSKPARKSKRKPVHRLEKQDPSSIRDACLATPNDVTEHGASKEPPEDTAVPINLYAPEILGLKTEEFAALQKSDPSLKSLISQLEPTLDDSKPHQILERKGLFYRAQHGKRKLLQLLVPERCRSTVLHLSHSSPLSGHLGINKTKDRIARRFFWPHLPSDVAEFCRSCYNCQLISRRRPLEKVPMQQMPVLTEPFTRISMDVVGPLIKSSSGNRFILVIVDLSTRYPEAIPLRTTTAAKVSEELIKYFSRFGLPQEILTDQGQNFMSAALKKVYKALQIKPIRTSPYHPQTNGCAESVNSTLITIIKKFIMNEPKAWDKYLPLALFAYRESTHPATGFTPFELLYGKNPRGILDLLKESWESQIDTEPLSVVKYIIELRQKLSLYRDLSRESQEEASKSAKLWYDRKTKQRELQQGDEVLLLLPQGNHKLEVSWRGPYRVLRRVGRVNYEIQLDGPRKKTEIFHINLLRKFFRRTPSDQHHSDSQRNATSLFCLMQPDEDEEADDNLQNYPEDPSEEPVDFDNIIDQGIEGDDRDKIKSLLEEYEDVISNHIGVMTDVEHDIDTGDAKPIRMQPYRIPEAKLKAVKSELDRLVKLGVIQRSQSDWASPIVIVPKKSGEIRICSDSRRLNSITKPEIYPMPRIDELVPMVSKYRYISVFDCRYGYWQIRLTKNGRIKGAFTTPFGTYEWLVMPFGLRNAPFTYQRYMDKILEEFHDFCRAFFDDIVIFSMTIEEHIQHLRAVLDRLRRQKVTIGPAKAKVACSKVEYLGHIVGNERIQPSDTKTEAVQNFKRPQTKTQLRAFLGLTGYYQNFVKNYAAVARPLTELTRKGVPDKITKSWKPVHESAFQHLKTSLCRPPILRSPDFDRPFVLQTDASDFALGAVLTQEYSDGEHPVSFVSKKLLPRECNFSTVEKECYAIKWAIQKLEYYLYGRHFTVQTDHSPLQWLNSVKSTNRRLARWSAELQQYDFEIKARPGTANANADALSRFGHD